MEQTIPVNTEESPAQQFARIPKEIRDDLINKLPKDKLEALPYDWSWWARPKQRPPEPNTWKTWVILAGRGFGKTRTGAEWVRNIAESRPGTIFAIVGPTAGDVRRIMVEGPSGILKVSPPWNKATYYPAKARIDWENGSYALLYSADEPDRIRGNNHHYAWCDEVCFWRYPDAWDQLQFTLRLPGIRTQTIVTTTPKPVALLTEKILKKEDIASGKTIVTTGSSYENRDNLSEDYLETLISAYEGTPLGAQEIYAVILEDLEGALWQRKHFKYKSKPEHPEYKRVVVAIDPAVTSKKDSDETGICVAAKGVDDNYYVLHLKGYKLSPQGWADKALSLYEEHQADKIVAEINNGGDMVENTIRQAKRDVPLKTIHATRGKTLRAEPIVSIYERGKVFHEQMFEEGESQMVKFTGEAGNKDDLVDALVYALTELSDLEYRSYTRPKVGGYRTKVSELRLI